VESGSKSFIQPNQPSSIRTNAVGYLLKEQISPRTFHCVPLLRARTHDLFSLSRLKKIFCQLFLKLACWGGLIDSSCLLHWKLKNFIF